MPKPKPPGKATDRGRLKIGDDWNAIRIIEWAGGKEQSMAWYRAQPIAAFGGRTAEGLVKEGLAGPLRDYLDHLAIGNFA